MLRALSFGLGLLFAGVTLANDFPTQARVEFVLGCMNEQGGQSYDTLSKCDVIVGVPDGYAKRTPAAIANSNWMAMPYGVAPTRIVAMTFRDAVSITDTSLDGPFAVYRNLPSPRLQLNQYLEVYS